MRSRGMVTPDDSFYDFDELTIFGLQAGRDGQNTLLFRNGSFKVLEQRIIFTYKSASTGNFKSGMFMFRNISGFSHC